MNPLALPLVLILGLNQFDIPRAINDLASPSWRARDRATKRLIAIGPLASEAVSKAKDSEDVEVVKRATLIESTYNVIELEISAMLGENIPPIYALLGLTNITLSDKTTLTISKEMVQTWYVTAGGDAYMADEEAAKKATVLFLTDLRRNHNNRESTINLIKSMRTWEKTRSIDEIINNDT